MFEKMLQADTLRQSDGKRPFPQSYHVGDKITLRRVLALICVLVVTAIGTKSASALEGLSRGHNTLLQRGLQIQTLSFPGITPAGRNTGTAAFDPARWVESNFTAIHIWARTYGDAYPAAYLPAAPGIPWGMTDYTYDVQAYQADPVLVGNIEPTAYPYSSSLVSYQYGDEQNIADAIELAAVKAAMALFRVNQPNAIVYTNQWAGQASTAAMQNYMRQAQPDMLSFDAYPFNGSVVGGSPTALYSELQRYRKLGLAGNDGTGSQPILTGLYTQTFTSAGLNNHVVSESEIRLNQFSAWAFGYKFADSFVYERPLHDTTVTPVLFSDSGNTTNSPTAQFYQAAETNRQSLNLGPALVRLISTDVRIKLGSHKGGFLNLHTYTNDRAADVSEWSTVAIPYITGISATNLGSKNNGLAGDVLVGTFKPLDGSFTNAGHADDDYFMIVNGLSDATGLAADCRQQIRLDFDFGTSGISSLLRLSRDTGKIEMVSMTHESGSAYRLDLYLDGGTGDLFKFNNGGIFVVPESGTLALLLAGVVGLLGYGWQKHRRLADVLR
jgi:hypothetical protein